MEASARNPGVPSLAEAPHAVASRPDEAVIWEVEGHVATLRLNRPPMNLLSPEMRAGLHTAFETVGRQPDVRVILLAGNGARAFSAGANLREEARLTPDGAVAFKQRAIELGRLMAACPQPIVAAIQGFCMGGGFQLALGCDLRIAAEGAKFAAAGVKMGLVTSAVRLTRLLGEAGAKDLILTGRTIAAVEALRLGIVSRVVSDAALLDEARATAAQIAARPPLAVQAIKRLLGQARDLAPAEALAAEHDEFCRLHETRDHRTAVEAFFRKETPRFRGE